MTDIEQSVAKIKQKVKDGEFSRYLLAKTSGVNLNTLANMHSASWNPTLETIVRLEKASNELAGR